MGFETSKHERTLARWEQWVDETNLFACISNGSCSESIDGSMMVAHWQHDQWVDVTTALVPEPRLPNEMEHIAMWTELPEPDPALLKELHDRQTRTSVTRS